MCPSTGKHTEGLRVMGTPGRVAPQIASHSQGSPHITDRTIELVAPDTDMQEEKEKQTS